MPVAYPTSLPLALIDKTRDQPAAFQVAQPRRGFGYVEPIGTDTAVFWPLTWRFNESQAQTFWQWFVYTTQRGVLPFTMGVRTEFGVVTQELQMLPEGLMPAKYLGGGVWEYRANVMARTLSGVPTLPPEVFARATTTKSFTSSFAVTMPSLVAGHMLIVAHASQRGADSHVASGWTKLAEDGSSTSLRTTVFAKVAAGGDTCTVTSGGNGWQYARAFSVAGCSGLSQITAAIAYNSNTTPDPPNCAPGVGANNFLALAFGAHTGLYHTTAAPSGYGNAHLPGPNGQDIEVLVCSAERTAVGIEAEDPGAFTIVSDGGVLVAASATVLLRA